MVIDVDNISIEHVYPQNARNADRDSGLEQEKHGLANLSIWDPRDNKVSGNDSFSSKVVAYKNSRSGVTRALAELPSWDMEQYRKRLAELLEDARRVFVV
jgi:hypothetical protein